MKILTKSRDILIRLGCMAKDAKAMGRERRKREGEREREPAREPMSPDWFDTLNCRSCKK